MLGNDDDMKRSCTSLIVHAHCLYGVVILLESSQSCTHSPIMIVDEGNAVV